MSDESGLSGEVGYAALDDDLENWGISGDGKSVVPFFLHSTLYFAYDFITEVDDYTGPDVISEVFDQNHVPSPVMARHIRRLSECTGDYSGAEMESFDSGVCDISSPVSVVSEARSSGRFPLVGGGKIPSNATANQRKSKKQLMTLAHELSNLVTYFQAVKFQPKMDYHRPGKFHVVSMNEIAARKLAKRIPDSFKSYPFLAFIGMVL